MRELRNCNEIVKMDSRTVEGYALVFGKQSRDLGGFTEVIEPTALEGILEKSDILVLLHLPLLSVKILGLRRKMVAI